jgi:Protein of unknown function (DUF3237)
VSTIGPFDPVTPRFEYLFRAAVELAPLQRIGPVAAGERRVYPIVGGTFAGERLRGVVLPGGADWQIVRPDGAALLDARYTIQTDDGALILVQNRGIRHGPPEVLARALRGEIVDPAEYYFRTTPTFETSAPQYAWLNDLIGICSAVRGAAAVIIDFYAVR